MKWIIMMILVGVTLFGAVDINNASAKELTSLKGIGVKKAEAIISYRKEHCFTNVQDITKVKGIGKKFLEKNRTQLKAGTCSK